MTIEIPQNKIQITNLSLIEVTGPDSADFLHAQFTGDCKSLTENQMMLTSWCSPKGRVLYLIRIVKSEHKLLLLVSTEQKDDFLKRLKMFLFRSKVILKDCSESHSIIVCHGESSLSSTYPNGAIKTKFTDDQQWVFTPKHSQSALWNSLNMETATSDHIKIHDVLYGIPSLPEELYDQFLPQEMNLENLNGLSFEKGCYPGQEIIARVKYRGKVKRCLKRYSIKKSEPIEVGSKLIDAGQKPIGIVIESIEVSPNHQELLAVVSIDCNEVRLLHEPTSNLTAMAIKTI
jgi:folate-binding protein YgfZ